ncbi:hypothetical protein [Hydrogenophaga intermedia]|uniref:Lipoprotein n=1 Tax=Hydrogenophaga intermedia TaxID=65786 RepID=A0A1L1PMN9_HYDIT|nr:hypothetical protein [Hydrogenophaga intermedia]TMU77319.1 hypothetical protein FGJ01_05555 [Hydrogenophaga intermedia]CDN87306.1 hypothetical protein BN948_01726 [Hydrogenophaga intermedia]
MRIVATAVLLGALSACAMPTTQDVEARWKGQRIEQAVAVLGPPQATTPLPGGVTVYTWEKTYGSANAIKRSTCRTGLHANQEGVIVAASQLSESLLCGK